MDASSIELRTNILDWDENDVHNWLTKLGFPQYEQQVKGSCLSRSLSSLFPNPAVEHSISGDVLVLLDQDSLKEIGIAKVGPTPFRSDSRLI